MLVITKNAMIKLVKKNTMDSWRESGRNHAIRLIRQVQQLSHTIEKKWDWNRVIIFCGERLKENLCAAGEFHSGSTTNNQHVQKLTESWSEIAIMVISRNMQNYALAMFVQIKYFIIKATFHHFITDIEHQKLRRMMVQTSVKRFFPKRMCGDKFQTTYMTLMDAHNLSCTPHDASFLKFLKENVPDVNDSKPHGVI